MPRKPTRTKRPSKSPRRTVTPNTSLRVSDAVSERLLGGDTLRAPGAKGGKVEAKRSGGGFVVTYVPRSGPTLRYERTDAGNAAFLFADHAGAGNALRAAKAPGVRYAIVSARGRIKIRGVVNAWKSRETAEGALAILSRERCGLKIKPISTRA